MSAECQCKLLRVLQEHAVRPVGGSREEPVEFRLVAASNRDLEELVAAGTFRADLFYRLAVVRLLLPRLAERPADIAPLARHFLARATVECLAPGGRAPELAPDALAALATHPWPGNVRELQNAIRRAVVVCAGPELHAHHLGLQDEAQACAPRDAGELDYQAGKQRAIERFQREFVHRALEAEGGNVSRAAERCHLTRAAFQRIMRQLGIDRRAFRDA
jgi:DNA-binding NtrC family response regulator